MTISSIVDIVHGELLNKPSINRIENIKIDAKKVKRGDLYISFFDDDIDIALNNGAYGLIVSRKRAVTDSECAWIAVDDLNEAVLLLLRYILIEKDIVFYHFEEPCFSISKKMLGRDRSIAFLENSAYSWIDNILENENIRYCISDRKSILNILTSDVKVLPEIYETVVLKESLFCMTLFCNENYHSIRLSSRLKDYVCAIIDFSEKNNLSYSYDSLPEGSVFQAHYVNSRAEIVSKPSKYVVIFDRCFSSSYSQESVKYLQEFYKWAKILYLADYEKTGSIFFKDEKELKQIMSGQKFDIAFVQITKDISLEAYRKSQSKQECSTTLFNAFYK